MLAVSPSSGIEGDHGNRFRDKTQTTPQSEVDPCRESHGGDLRPALFT